MIFDKDIVWDGKSIAYSNDDIKELDEAIVHIEISESEAKEIEDIHLVKDAKVDKLTPKVTRQADYKNEDLDENLEVSE